MRISLVIFLSLFFIAFTLSCGKNDAPVGIIYKPGDTGNESLKEGMTQQNASPAIDLKQIQEKLRLMNNNDVFQYALDSQNQGKYSEAMAAYDKILTTDKNYPEIYYYQGLLYRDMNMRDEAICAFQTAIIQNPNSLEAYYNLGYAYRCKGLHNEAIAAYKKALELSSENKTKQKSSIHYNLGFSYFASGLIDEAILEYKKALTYKPKDKEIHQKLGIAYTAKGWADKAKNEFSSGNENTGTPSR